MLIYYARFIIAAGFFVFIIATVEKYCPICGKKVVKPAKDTKQTAKTADFFPFCSERCKLIDLNAWFESKYVISNRLEERENNKPDEPENMLK